MALSQKQLKIIAYILLSIAILNSKSNKSFQNFKAIYISNNNYWIIKQNSINYYSNETGSVSCLKCPVGSYSLEGADSCITCLDGQYYSNGACLSCKAGTFSKSGAIKCTTCKAGTYSTPGSDSCTTCKAGTYSNPGSDSCSKCQDSFILKKVIANVLNAL